VAAIPVSAFYDQPGAPTHYARFAFCKRPEVLDEAITRLQRHFARAVDAVPARAASAGR